MKHSKFQTLKAIAVLLMFSTCAIAQKKMERLKNTTPEERAQFQTQTMKEKLGLNTEQEKQVGDINLKYAQKMDPVIKNDGGKMEKFKAAKTINKDKEAELKTVFTTEQYEKYSQLKDEMKEAVIERAKEKNKSKQ